MCIYLYGFCTWVRSVSYLSPEVGSDRYFQGGPTKKMCGGG